MSKILVPLIFVFCNTFGIEADSISNYLFSKVENNEYEIQSVSLCSDTLKLLSSSQVLYYPFGRFSSIISFEKSYPEKFVKTVEKCIKSLEVPGQTDTLFRFSFKESYILAIDIDNTEDYKFKKDEMVITKAKITNKEIKLQNGDSIGIPKDLLLRYFFTEYKGLNKIKVVELVRALDGVWIIYTLSNNLVVKIDILTDYKF
jgi:hypothetical protein